MVIEQTNEQLVVCYLAPGSHAESACGWMQMDGETL